MSGTDTRPPAARPRAASLRALLPPLPREHGTWAWLLLPTLVGLLAIDWPGLPAWLLFVAAVLGFLARAATEEWRASRPRGSRFLAWGALLGLGVVLTAVPVLVRWERWLLLPLGAGIAVGPVGVQAVRWLRIRHRVLGEAVVVASLSLLAPAVAYAGSGDFDRWTGFLWLPAALYLWGGITYVRLSLAPATARAAPLRRERRRTAALYHAGLPLALAAAVVGGAVPAPPAFAYVPMLVKAAHSLWRDAPVDRVQRLGIGEAVHAAAFAGLLIALYRLAG